MSCNPFHLSEREQQIVNARARGSALKQIAADLQISINTVKTHLRRIFAKLNVQCSLELLQLMQPDCEHCPYAPKHHAPTLPRRARLNSRIRLAAS